MSGKKQFEYVVMVHLVLEMNAAHTGSRPVKCDVNLAAADFLEKQWKGGDGVVNGAGLKAQTQGLIQGLVANIHVGHQMGMWDSAEHLRYIIKYLEDGFIKQAEATTGNFLE